MEGLHFEKGRIILPLVGSSFEPGKMEEAIDSIKDAQLAEIVHAEACYFSADATGCVEIVKKYKMNIVFRHDLSKKRKGYNCYNCSVCRSISCILVLTI